VARPAPAGRKVEAAAGEPVLRVQGLRVSFSTADGALQAVRGVDFSLAKGECLGIVGESGSGKSVSAAAVLGLLGREVSVQGRVLLHGRELLGLGPGGLREVRGTRLSMIFQEPSRSFDPIYSIGKTFEETLRVKEPGLPATRCQERAERLLGEVHIPRAGERLKNFPHQLSGGMLQRIMISLALANDPEVLIADEPTTALDVTIQAEIVALLKELQVQRKLSLIFISHNLALVGQVADRLLVMYAGLVLETGPSAEVLTRPRSPYTRALLGSLPAWGSHYSRENLATIKGSVPDPAHPEPGCPFAPRCPLAVDRCRQAVPPLVRDQGGQQVPAETAGGELGRAGGQLDRAAEEPGSAYRCIFPGVKL
jgi:peptide/nickel transport system permease protein